MSMQKMGLGEQKISPRTHLMREFNSPDPTDKECFMNLPTVIGVNQSKACQLNLPPTRVKHVPTKYMNTSLLSASQQYHQVRIKVKQSPRESEQTERIPINLGITGQTAKQTSRYKKKDEGDTLTEFQKLKFISSKKGSSTANNQSMNLT